MIALMRPSNRLFFDPDVIYEDARARQRALWFYQDVGRDVRSTSELGWCLAQVESAKDILDALTDARPEVGPFPSRWPELWRKLRRKGQEGGKEWEHDQRLHRIAEVADSYPRLLAWLAEGRVSRYWNVFGLWIGISRSIWGVRRLVWRYFFKPIAHHAPWRLALYEVILQAARSELTKKSSGQPVSNSIQGLSAVTDIAMMTNTAAPHAIAGEDRKDVLGLYRRDPGSAASASEP